MYKTIYKLSYCLIQKIYKFFLNTCFQRSNPVTLVTPKMLKTDEPTIVPIPMSPSVTKEPKNKNRNSILNSDINTALM